MTDKQRYIRGCMFAISKLMDKGSFAFTRLETVGNEVQTTKWVYTPWTKIMDWLVLEFESEDNK